MKKNLLGMRFGKLIVVDDAKLTNKKQSYWICLCDCGNEVVARGSHLRSGNVGSCGCRRKLPLGQASFNKLYSFYGRQARNRGYNFELTKEQFKNITSKNCFYCGKPPLQSCKSFGNPFNGDYLYNGIDRVENSRGYVEGNVVPCCGVCNRAKDVMSYNEFISWIESVHNNHGDFV